MEKINQKKKKNKKRLIEFKSGDRIKMGCTDDYLTCGIGDDTALMSVTIFFNEHGNVIVCFDKDIPKRFKEYYSPSQIYSPIPNDVRKQFNIPIKFKNGHLITMPHTCDGILEKSASSSEDNSILLPIALLSSIAILSGATLSNKTKQNEYM